mmetsp:Transcript_34737/g.33887  ORF Transcript_34737/g.33887 Transcript_34737/m.33887 type:complete len:122 (+) Transcript_34737:126-491(+)
MPYNFELLLNILRVAGLDWDRVVLALSSVLPLLSFLLLLIFIPSRFHNHLQLLPLKKTVLCSLGTLLDLRRERHQLPQSVLLLLSLFFLLTYHDRFLPLEVVRVLRFVLEEVHIDRDVRVG